VYSSLRRDTTRFKPAGAGEFEIVVPSDAEVLQVIAEAELEHEFAGLKFLVTRYGAAWQTKIQELLERGLLEKYQVDNPKNPEFRTSAIRIVRQAPEVRAVLLPETVRALERKIGYAS
jgi:hypothetical protein